MARSAAITAHANIWREAANSGPGRWERAAEDDDAKEAAAQLIGRSLHAVPHSAPIGDGAVHAVAHRTAQASAAMHRNLP